MASFTVVYDANVLVPAVLRDLLLRLGREGLVRARFSETILDEMFVALHDILPAASHEKLPRLRTLVAQAVPDSLVEGYEPLISMLNLPDADDRHVLAAAIKCAAQAVVTFNLDDFPRDVLAEFSIEAMHPDDFVADLIDLAPIRVWRVIEAQAASLTNPVCTPADVLERLRMHIPQSVGLLESQG